MIGARDFMFLYFTPPPAAESCSRDNLRTTFRISLIFLQDWWPCMIIDYLIRFWLISVMNFRTWNFWGWYPRPKSNFCPRLPPAHFTPATRLIFVKIPLLRPPPPPIPHPPPHPTPSPQPQSPYYTTPPPPIPHPPPHPIPPTPTPSPHPQPPTPSPQSHPPFWIMSSLFF